MFCPRLNEVEPLKAEIASFIDCVAYGYRPKTDGYNGLEVVRVLEAADRSLHGEQGAVKVAQVEMAATRNGRNGD